MATVEHDVKYLMFEVDVTGNVGLTPADAEDVVRGYLNKGFSVVNTTVTNVSNRGFFVVHVLTK